MVDEVNNQDSQEDQIDTYLNKPRYKFTDDKTGNSFLSMGDLPDHQVISQFEAMEKAGINMSDPQQNVKYGKHRM